MVQGTTGCFKKTVLIENRLKTQNMKLNYTGRAVFLLNDHHYDMENTYLYSHGCFFDGSWVFSGYFMGVSRELHDYFKNVSMRFFSM